MTRIESTKKLTEYQIKKIKKLQNECMAADGTQGKLCLDSALNFFKDMPCFYLTWDYGRLVGVLSVFAPVADTAEISALVKPDYRRMGYYGTMLSAARKQFNKYGVTKEVFVHEVGSPGGKEMLTAHGAAVDHSEYLMVWQEQRERKPFAADGLLLMAARSCDEKDMTTINMAVFGEDEEGAANMVRKNLNGKDILCYNAYSGGEMVGVCCVNVKPDALTLFGLGIAPTHQGKGYGRIMLGEIIRLLKSRFKQDIELEVDTVNKRAVSLYRTSGFAVKTQYDYYEIDDNTTK